MRRTIILTLLALVATSHALDLTGTVRDFRMRGTEGGHPDFESGIGGLQTGLVKNALSADGKPVFNGNDGDGFITSAATFDQWYRDVPGVNASLPLTLSLSQNTGGPFEYSSNSFFPIDDQGFGNQGQSHNYSFTFELNTRFAYETSRNLVFGFSGDDDVWVYVNGKLAVDLGGVHGAVGGSVDLNARAADLGLVSGEFYRLDLFFAERHTSASNFSMQTNIDLEPVPEPASLAVLGLGALAILRRRRAAQS